MTKKVRRESKEYINPLTRTKKSRELERLLKKYEVRAYCHECKEYVTIKEWTINCAEVVAFHRDVTGCGVCLIGIYTTSGLKRIARKVQDTTMTKLGRTTLISHEPHPEGRGMKEEEKWMKY